MNLAWLFYTIIMFLMEHVVASSTFASECSGNSLHKVIIHSNAICQHLNITVVFEFACARQQRIYIFMAQQMMYWTFGD
ncbi:hypothetical protein BDZ91DRAFT_117891 [Kalaharituber pfeilii]|nr:hypothetical protein BDZ91DRAFT_117891 [Kalaharituber pfeilii]